MPSLLSVLRKDLGSTFWGMSICRLNSRRTLLSLSVQIMFTSDKLALQRRRQFFLSLTLQM